MSARDELRKYVNLLADACTPRETTDNRVEWLYGLVNAETRRECAAKIREVGTAKGWSTWAAAFIDPDTEFVDTGMPATEAIVAELRRRDRLAVLHEVDEHLAAMTLPEHLKGTLNAGSYADAWRECRARVQALAAGAGPEKGTGAGSEKGTGDGGQPTAGEPTPDFFQPGRTYRHNRWTFRVDAITAHPGNGERAAFGWWRFARGEWAPFSAAEQHWANGWRDLTETTCDSSAPSHAIEDTPEEGT
ncbi:hypothetical protein [Streptomyces sp. NPDC056160]|uniref:hypothetical protein n=1 Tax=Streptomyces sp. NPDC056160 TaxID=3345731 RepID=UPI0035D71645